MELSTAVVKGNGGSRDVSIRKRMALCLTTGITENGLFVKILPASERYATVKEERGAEGVDNSCLYFSLVYTQYVIERYKRGFNGRFRKERNKSILYQWAAHS